MLWRGFKEQNFTISKGKKNEINISKEQINIGFGSWVSF